MPYRFAVLALVLAVQAAATIPTIGLPALAPILREDLGLSRTAAGSLVSGFYVGSLLVGVPAGYLADRLGVRWTLAVGQALVAACVALLAGAGSAAAVPACIAAAGFGWAIVNPTSTKAVIAWFPAAARATAVGVKQMGLPLGGAIGAWLLPRLADTIGWRGALRLAAVAVVAVALATALAYRERPEPGATPPTPPRPGAPWRLLRDRNLWRVSVVTGLFAAVQTSWTGYIVLFLTEAAGRDVVGAARFLALANLAGIAGRVGFGALSDRLFGGRRRIVLALAGAGSGLAGAATALVGPSTPDLWLALLALVFGLVGIGWNGVQLTLLAELAGKPLAGTAVGLGLALSALGVILGPPAFGWVVDVAGGWGPAWLGLAATIGVALVLLARVREPEREVERDPLRGPRS